MNPAVLIQRRLFAPAVILLGPDLLQARTVQTPDPVITHKRLIWGIIIHDKSANSTKNRASMIRNQSHKQLSSAEFDWPLQTTLDENNRWVKMSQCIPWDVLTEGYFQGISFKQGRPAKDARLVRRYRCTDPGETLLPVLRGLGRLSNGGVVCPFVLVMNLLILLGVIFALINRGIAVVRAPLLRVVEILVRYRLAHYAWRRCHFYRIATS